MTQRVARHLLRLVESSKAKLQAFGHIALKRCEKSVGLQVFGLAQFPVQQYLADCIAKQALLQPTTFPPLLTSNAEGQHTFKSTSQDATPHPIPPPTGFIETGKLNPSTKLTSQKCMGELEEPSVISTTVAGGFPPFPLQCNWFEQSPVVHEPFPLLSKLHPCLPHIRPDHFSGASRTTSSPLPRWNPPSFGVAWPAPPSIPGHMLSLQLFTRISCAPSANHTNVKKKI